MKSFSRVLNAMSNEKRLEILAALLDAESSVNALAYKLALSQSALSQHLSKLRAANLVSTRREAQTIYYAVSSPAVAALLEALEKTVGSHQQNGADLPKRKPPR